MSITEIQKLPRAEKMKLMEALWDDLSRNDEEFESPAWHKTALRDSERLLKSGKARFIDWDEAKKRLRRRAAKLA